jgi:hypothetical protein
VRKKTNPTWEHFKLLIFVLFLCELILFLLGIIFGRVVGYKYTLAASFLFGVIVALCYALIIFANVVIIWLQKAFLNLKKGKEKHPHHQGPGSYKEL